MLVQVILAEKISRVAEADLQPTLQFYVYRSGLEALGPIREGGDGII